MALEPLRQTELLFVTLSHCEKQNLYMLLKCCKKNPKKYDKAPKNVLNNAKNAQKSQKVLNFHSRWSFEQAVAQTMLWYKAVHEGADPLALTRTQIVEFSAL